MIKGITIQLVVLTQDGKDPFGEPIYKKSTIDVNNVLVGEPSTDDITASLELYGKRVAYTLALPKGDNNNWIDAEVILPSPFNGRFKTIGIPTAGIEANIPLGWNKKVKLERYGEECSI